MTRPFDPSLTAHLVAGPGILVALDIDGTLVGPDGAASPAVVAAVRAVRDAGAHVVPATGRSLTGLRPVLENLGIETTWAVTSNGAVSSRFDPALPGGVEVTDVITFDPEPALRLLRGLVPESLVAVERLGEGFLVSGHFPPGELTGDVRVVPFEDLCEAPASRVTVRAPHLTPDELREIVARSDLDDVTYAIGWTAWLDLTAPGVNKASALEILRTRFGVAPEATVAVGDGHNDLEMLRWADVGLAMGGSDAMTTGAADAVVGHVEDDGVVPVLLSLLR